MKVLIKFWFVFLWSALISISSIGQTRTDDFGNWMMYFGVNKLSDKWSIHSEIQWRHHTVEPNIEQLLIRSGFNYHFNNSNMLTTGYAYISSHPFDKDSISRLSAEHRIWQQFITKNNLWRIFFEHRYRLEQRWVDINPDLTHRARYRIMASIALNKPNIESGTFFIGLYDEVFLNIKRNGVFDRNRLYGALGYQFSGSTSAQIGVMNQAVNGFNKYYLQLGLFFNPKLYKEEKEG